MSLRYVVYSTLANFYGGIFVKWQIIVLNKWQCTVTFSFWHKHSLQLSQQLQQQPVSRDWPIKGTMTPCKTTFSCKQNRISALPATHITRAPADRPPPLRCCSAAKLVRNQSWQYRNTIVFFCAILCVWKWCVGQGSEQRRRFRC